MLRAFHKYALVNLTDALFLEPPSTSVARNCVFAFSNLRMIADLIISVLVLF